MYRLLRNKSYLFNCLSVCLSVYLFSVHRSRVLLKGKQIFEWRAEMFMSPVMDSHVFSHLFDLISFIALSLISFILSYLVLPCHPCLVLSTPFFLFFSHSPLFISFIFSLLFSCFILFVTFSRSFSFPILSAPSIFNYFLCVPTLN